MDPLEWLKLVQQGGLLLVAVLILFGGAKRVWVWGYQLKEAQQQRDEWKDIALRNRELVGRATSVAADVAQQLGSR